MRNAILVPINSEECLIVASDNSGSIGMKKHDLISAAYETLAYYSFRVAAMECIAAGGEIISVVLHNFCGNEPWGELVRGVQKGLRELGLKDVSITGSTESNFPLLQSAIGVVVIGKGNLQKINLIPYCNQLNLAVIGLPLVGNEVIEQEEHIAPLSVFHKVSQLSNVISWPVGSKGVLYELNQLFANHRFTKEMVIADVDLLKSSGPATCFISAFFDDQVDVIKNLTAGLIHPLEIKKE